MVYQTLFDGVPMAIIHMVGKITIISNGVFPKSPLPQAIFATIITV
jgi:hypothetical protein